MATILNTVAILFILTSLIPSISFWKKFRKLDVGDTLSDEVARRGIKDIKFGICLFGIGAVLAIIAIFI